MTRPALTEICVCPQCRGDLATDAGGLRCTQCGRAYPLVGGIPILLPDYEDAERRRHYVENYEQIARDDLDDPLVPGVFDLMHTTLLDFVGDVRGRSVLDVGSAYGSYLDVLDAGTTVAVDIALSALQRIPAASTIFPVCGDAEFLPVRLGRFDVVIVSDVLEHLLEPEALVARLTNELPEGARVIVHVPWRESLEQYRDSPYAFTHLRSFDEYSFRQLFWGFDVVQERGTLPLLAEPVIFRLGRLLPLRLYNELVSLYFDTPLSELEYRKRERWIRELPRRERWLLRLYEPQVKLFELRKRQLRRRRRAAALVERWARSPASAGRAADDLAPRSSQEVCP